MLIKQKPFIAIVNFDTKILEIFSVFSWKIADISKQISGLLKIVDHFLCVSAEMLNTKRLILDSLEENKFDERKRLYQKRLLTSSVKKQIYNLL